MINCPIELVERDTGKLLSLRHHQRGTHIVECLPVASATRARRTINPNAGIKYHTKDLCFSWEGRMGVPYDYRF